MLKSQVFTSSGTFNVPETVSCVFAHGVGAGGQGLDGTDSAAAAWMCAGGGSGAFCMGAPIPVTPGGTLAITIGSAGIAGRTAGGYTKHYPMATGGSIDDCLGAPGTYPGDTIIGPIRLGAGMPAYLGISDAHASPGSGGGAGGPIENPEGTARDGRIGALAGHRFFGGSSGGRQRGASPGYSGGAAAGDRAGGVGGDGGEFVSGGGGASSPWGDGGDAGDSDVNGSNGTGYGAGGGGSSAGTGHGGNGSQGRVVIFWNEA